MAKSERPRRGRRDLDPTCNVVPDRLDLRDRPYLPTLHMPPPPTLAPKLGLPVLHQGRTNACTGFALASVVLHLLRVHRDPEAAPVSPFMLYSMARRYDDLPGTTARRDAGSTLRGAMKGWFRHGACRADLWRGLRMPPANPTPENDWWPDAAQRPLGAYYRVDTRSVTDMHVALSDVGVLYASAMCHRGWFKGSGVTAGGECWTIPVEEAHEGDGGHAFAIVGYTARGFIVLNSWGPGWGRGGLAVLTYEDWTDNAMDCWVAQLGVITEQHIEIARAPSLRVRRGRVQIASERNLRNREISPFVVDLQCDGRLSTSGLFRTQAADVAALVGFHAGHARKTWGLRASDAMDVAIYAHSGLTGEDETANAAARWIPALYDAQVFPIFLMWEANLWKLLEERLRDLVAAAPQQAAGGQVDQLQRFSNERLERLFAPAGSLVWSEMKRNADGVSNGKDSGGLVLYRSARASRWFTRTPVRLHLIGHSAGAIVHCHIVDRLARLGWRFESVTFMAAAATVDLFRRTVAPRIAEGMVRRFHALHLSDAAERHDDTCRHGLGYGRSLLYLASEALEGGVCAPILGMQKYFDAESTSGRPARTRALVAPGRATGTTTHGGFDEDRRTMESVIHLIKRRAS